MSADELVLCTPRRLLPVTWLPTQSALMLCAAQLAAPLAGLTPVWLPRHRAETDPGHKQWIAYGILEDSVGRFASYPRKGGEARLHGLRSLGIGGHVNPVDAPAPFDWLTALHQGFARELAEEYPAATVGVTRLLGIVNEDTSQVGRVHLGLVFHHRLDYCPAPPPGELAGLEWLLPSELASRTHETWSLLALQLLSLTNLRS
jgi:predicted NUDIX family phosphoesterase